MIIQCISGIDISIFTGLAGCRKSHTKNTTSILSTWLLSAQHSNRIRHILKAGSDMIALFGLSNQRTSYINKKRAC